MRPNKWEYIANVLRTRILDGIYPPGSLFPSTLELMNEFMVYSATIQTAINYLKGENLLIPSGKGRRIVRPAMKLTVKKDLYDDVAFGFLKIRELSIILDREDLLPENIAPPALLYKAIVLNSDFKASPPPISLVDYCLAEPTGGVSSLNKIKARLRNNQNFFTVIRDFDIIPFSYKEYTTAESPSEDDKKLLGLPSNVLIPVVKITREVYNKNGGLIIYCHITDRSDCFKYEHMVSHRLKQLRQEVDISLQEMEFILGMNMTAISQLEKGETQPSLKTLQTMSDYFGVTIDYMLGRSDVRGNIEEDLFKDLPIEAVDNIKQFIAFMQKKHKIK